MSKHWTPNKPTVVLKPSRIRRDPVRPANEAPPARRTARRSDETELWFGVTGVLLIAGTIVLAIVAISIATFTRDDPAAAASAERFGQCYDGGANCVVDGETIFVRGQKLTIAGMDAPQIQGARCDVERSRGIDAAVRLADLLNRGPVSVGPAFRDDFGRVVRKVEVKGQDVRRTMVDLGLARRFDGRNRGWCG